MGLPRAVAVVAVAVVAGAIAISGGSAADPRTPTGLPGLPAPFLGTAVIGSGGRAAAIDAYGDIVDLRAPGPAGRALVAVSADRQAAGTVPPDTAVIARARLADGSTPPFWRADSIRQRYLPGTNVLRTVARFGDERTVVVRRIGGVVADRRWLGRAQPLGSAAPPWARRMYARSLLVLRALTDRRTGAVAAGARDGWAYVWPRDAATVAMALASAGYKPPARRVARFLLRLDLDGGARFNGEGTPVAGRAAQGDAAGWIDAAARVAGLTASVPASPWQGRGDYQEGAGGDYLANAIASTAGGSGTNVRRPLSAQRQGEGRIRAAFETPRGLLREAGDPGSGLDSAAAWAVRPFPRPALFPAVGRTLLHLAAEAGRFGMIPSEHWAGGEDPWTAPTAWTALGLAALANADRSRGHSAVSRRERTAALHLMADLRRAATPLGLLPERVGARTGLPTSTTPLAWSHAFAILALRQLWPGRMG
jgi:hypothetical protein